MWCNRGKIGPFFVFSKWVYAYIRIHKLGSFVVIQLYKSLEHMHVSLYKTKTFQRLYIERLNHKFVVFAALKGLAILRPLGTDYVAIKTAQFTGI